MAGRCGCCGVVGMPNALQHTDVCPVPELQKQIDVLMEHVANLDKRLTVFARVLDGRNQEQT